MVISTVPTTDIPDRYSLLRAASLAVALAGVCSSLGWPTTSSAVHHWRLSNSNLMAILCFLYFQ
jgi:hypothetical protein